LFRSTKKKNVVNLAMDVLREVEDLHMFRHTSVQELMKIPGIGRIKAIEIMAATELGHRIPVAPQLKEGTVVSSSWVGNYLTNELSNLTQQNVVALYLNTKNEIVKKETIFIRSLNTSVAHPREIFTAAIVSSAYLFLVTHNHHPRNA